MISARGGWQRFVKAAGYAEPFQDLPKLGPVCSVPGHNLIEALESGEHRFLISKSDPVQTDRSKRTDYVGKANYRNNCCGNPNLREVSTQVFQSGQTEETVADPAGPDQESAHGLASESVQLMGVPPQH